MAAAKTWRLIALCLVVVLGMLIAVSSLHFLRAKRGYGDFVKKLGKREYIELTSAPINPSWIISGSPDCRANKFERSHDGSSGSGIWGCIGPAKFYWHYEGDESIYVLEGYAEIEYLGNKFTLRAGDSTHFTDGTKATWVVPEHIKKTYRIYDLGRVERHMRRIAK
jgi:uncharacterized cupin superfamily protein